MRKLLVLLLLFVAVSLHAAGARRGWIKIELTGGPLSAELLSRFGAEPIADYGSFAIAYVPRGALAALTAQAAKENVRVRARDELDVLHLPGAAVDAREGLGAAPPGKLIREYPRGKPGLFVLQFVGPLRSEWVAELQSIGWRLDRYIPNDGYIVVGEPELVGRTRQLAFVQWLDFFHPYQKAAFLPKDGGVRDLLFELPIGPAADSGIEAIRAAAAGEIRVRRGTLDTYVYATMSAASAEELLRHELIISVSGRPQGGLSDERQATSLTSNLDAAQTQPTSPQQYWNWITGAGRCPECADMPSSTWRVGIADTGLDDGKNFSGQGHPDLSLRKFYGARIIPPDKEDALCGGFLGCDAHGHGTAVAGILAGDNGTGVTDSLGFFVGRGIVPTAGIFSTKVFSTTFTRGDFDRFFEYTQNAANNGVTIQNHSFNDYFESPNTAGQYSPFARMYDVAVRDADDSLGFGRPQLLLAVAAGNNDQSFQDEFRWLVLPGGTAKNVLTMGGLESSRPENNGANCRSSRADSFRNVNKTSRLGTRMDPKYIKPDLMAPASYIVLPHTSMRWSAPSGFCLGAFGGDVRYSGDTGTSFAAPVGAGAALLVKRYLGNSPGATSPALAKAVLIAGARSVRGGEDRTHSPTITPIAAVPSVQQGFGRISLEDVFNGAQKPVWFDQAATRTFTQTGQVYRVRLRVRDSLKSVKVALVWTDTPATSGVSNPLVNDLNLEVIRNDSTTHVYVGNSLSVTNETNGEESIAHAVANPLPYDAVNNVEYFRSFMNANEEFEVAVKVWNLAGDTDGNLATFEQDFALVALNADAVNAGSPIAPVLTAQTNPTATTTVNLSWRPAANLFINRYEVFRGTTLGNMAFLTSTQATSATDSALAPSTTYIYRVVAIGSTGNATSNNDVATTIAFTPTVLPPGALVTASHFTQLRQGIDFVRTAAGLPTNTWAEGIAPGVVVKASHMNELRDKLEQALAALSAPPPVYQFPDPVAGVSVIRAADVNDLRNRVH